MLNRIEKTFKRWFFTTAVLLCALVIFGVCVTGAILIVGSMFFESVSVGIVFAHIGLFLLGVCLIGAGLTGLRALIGALENA